jgi:predicted transcriptional regulator
MSSDEFEKRFQHHVEFMLEQQARFDERLSRLEETQVRQTENINRQTENINRLVDVVSRMQEEMEANRSEIREAIDQLILGNEVTRDLANKVAALEVQTSQRVTSLERRVNDLEQEPS